MDSGRTTSRRLRIAASGDTPCDSIIAEVHAQAAHVDAGHIDAPSGRAQQRARCDRMPRRGAERQRHERFHVAA